MTTPEQVCCGGCWGSVPVADVVTLTDRLEVYRQLSDWGSPETRIALDGARFNDDEFPPHGLTVVTTEGCVRTVSGSACRPAGHGWIDEDGAWWPTTAIVGLPPAVADTPARLRSDQTREFGEVVE